eukprot:1431710-Prymnesium_polylepis.1
MEACPDRCETMLRSSGRTNELTQTAARRGRRAVEQSSYSCALVLATTTSSLPAALRPPPPVPPAGLAGSRGVPGQA